MELEKNYRRHRVTVYINTVGQRSIREKNITGKQNIARRQLKGNEIPWKEFGRRLEQKIRMKVVLRVTKQKVKTRSLF